MNPVVRIWIYGAALAAIYLWIALTISIFSRRSLRKRYASVTKNRIELRAKADALEYELRLALLASVFYRADIVVRIDGDEAQREEAMDIVRRMRRRHKNIFCKMI